MRQGVRAENSSNSASVDEPDQFSFRSPTLSDAGRIRQLVADSGVLDENSEYCYLLLCRDFGETSLVAYQGDVLVGFVTAYRPPGRRDCLFVWQVGVHVQARGQGLASRLLERLVCQPGCRGIRSLEATVTPSNTASRRLFESFASRHQIPCLVQPGFPAKLFASAGHEDEDLFCIGPLPASPAEKFLENQTS